MSTYYEYRDVKVMIALELMKRNGWKVYGFKGDESDAMTDYYDPAYWDGIAEKNGYVLVVDHSYPRKPEEIREYKNVDYSVNVEIQKKIQKLEQMTVERGASEQEEASARASIEKLLAKQNGGETQKSYIVTGIRPGYMANPPRCNWHIEKDGVIIAKGNGLLKFSRVYDYFYHDSYREDMMEFKRKTEDEYISDYTRYLYCHSHYYHTEEEARKSAEYHYNELSEDEKLFDKFNQFIGKLDTTAGGLMGNADYEYKKVKVTEHKMEYKAVETDIGEIKEGQTFILKTNFNYGRNRGYVYRIHESHAQYADSQKRYNAVRLNKKLTKELYGTSNSSNYMFSCSKSEDIQKWIDKGCIAFCEIQEVKVPYEVEKVIKCSIKKSETATEESEAAENKSNSESYTYDIKEDVDTRDDSKIWVVKILERLDKAAYIAESKAMRDRGGYYSKFKKGFIFRFNPAEKLGIEVSI